MKKNRKIELTLIENGIDYISEGLRLHSFGEYFPRIPKWKSMILNISAGIELILKEKLRQEHWSLIFEKPENSSTKKLENGDFVSVNLNTCIKRLENVCHLTFSEQEKKVLYDFKKIRNKIEHFNINFQEKQLEHKTGLVLKVIFDFIEKHFPNGSIPLELIKKVNYTKLKYITRFDGFYEIYRKKGEKKLEESLKNHLVICCPNCFRNGLILQKQTKLINCIICNYIDDKETFKAKQLEEKGTLESHVFDPGKCIHCKLELFYSLDLSEGSTSLYCIDCNYSAK